MYHICLDEQTILSSEERAEIDSRSIYVGNVTSLIY